MARIPTSRVVRRRDGAVVAIDHRQENGELYTRHGLAKAERRGRRLHLHSAPRDLGTPAEVSRIG